MPSILRSWAASRVLVEVAEPGRRVGHGLVEELAEQLVRHVVVRLDVGLRAGACVGGVVGQATVDEDPQLAHRRRHEIGELLGERGEQVGQVGARSRPPLARDVRLAEGHLEVTTEPAVELLRLDDLEHGGAGLGRTPRGAVREREADGDALGCGPDDRLRDPAGSGVVQALPSDLSGQRKSFCPVRAAPGYGSEWWSAGRSDRTRNSPVDNGRTVDPGSGTVG